MKGLAFQLLRKLGTGGFHSGEVLAKEFGTSRSAVSDALKEVEAEYGVRLYRLQRKGYKLETPIEFIDADEVTRLLGPAAKRIDLELLDTASSTNTLVLQRASAALTKSAASGLTIIAEHQTAGRGRLGRAWQSSLGGALTFSLLWRFRGGASQLGGLSLAVAVAVLRGLKAAGVPGVQVKWPNDLIADFCKVGGILIETQGDMLGPSAAVIGIGLNFRLPDEVKDRIDQPVSDLVTLAPDASRNRVFALVLKSLVEVLADFEERGFAPFRKEWESAHAYHGKPVRVVRAGERDLAAQVEGVADDGALLVRAGKDVLRLASAEISLRVAS